MTKKKKSGQYFCVSVTEVKAIAHHHLSTNSISPATSDTIVAYLILCRGAGKFDTTAWKANGICKRMELPFKRVETAISWLIQNDFVAKIAFDPKEIESESDIETRTEDGLPNTEQILDTTKGEKYRFRISRHHTGECIFLPNMLVDGQTGHQCAPALTRLLQDSKPDFRKGIDLHDTRLDAILLLLQLYSEHSLDSYGGVNPNVWRGTWMCGARKEAFENSPIASSIRDETFDFFSAQEDKEVFENSSLTDMFLYIDNELHRTQRLEHALKQLRASRLLYKVVQIWGRVCNSHKHYDLLYPLHILDSAQRNQDEPAVGPNILELVAKHAGEVDGIRQEYERIASTRAMDINDNYRLSNPDGIFFLAAKGVSMVPLTSLRLRYRAHDADTAAGLAEQRRMAERWQKNLESLL